MTLQHSLRKIDRMTLIKSAHFVKPSLDNEYDKILNGYHQTKYFYNKTMTLELQTYLKLFP